MKDNTLIIDDGNCRIVVHQHTNFQVAKNWKKKSINNSYNTFLQGTKTISFIPRLP